MLTRADRRHFIWLFRILQRRWNTFRLHLLLWRTKGKKMRRRQLNRINRLRLSVRNMVSNLEQISTRRHWKILSLPNSLSIILTVRRSVMKWRRIRFWASLLHKMHMWMKIHRQLWTLQRQIRWLRMRLKTDYPFAVMCWPGMPICAIGFSAKAIRRMVLMSAQTSWKIVWRCILMK